MTVDMKKYEELLQQIGGISQDHISREALENLKEKYRNEIHSKRMLNDIVDINSLLNVLKKRGVLQYGDNRALRDIIDEYVKNESIKQQIRDLITYYDQWLGANPNSVNFLYNSGKSNVFLSSHELNIPKTSFKVSEALYLPNDFDVYYQTSNEEMTKESLIVNVSLNNLNTMQNENDTDKNSSYAINSKKCPLSISRERGTTLLIILILIFILIGVIWILIKLPHEYAAVVPGNPSIQTASGRSQSNMPFYMSNTSTAGYSTQSTFSLNHTQIYTTTTSPPIDKEKELQKLVIKDLSKRIGIYWKDVCRSLGIDENTIDEITIEHSKEPFGNKYERMFKKGLTFYFSEPHPRWRIDLKKALRISKRVDLEERLGEIIQDHSNL